MVLPYQITSINISMILNLKKSIVFLLILSSISINAQLTKSISAGMSLPDNISSKYLITGIGFKYGLEFETMKNLFICTDLSFTFNNKNKSYREGFDDEPYFIEHPDEKKFYEMVHPTDFYTSSQLYIFNPSIGLQLKYSFLSNKKFSPYILGGFSANYSIFMDPILEFSYGSNGKVNTVVYSSGALEQQFNIGYQAGIGICYNFKNRNSIFIESQYKILPNVKFGKNNDRIGLFPINMGFVFH